MSKRALINLLEDIIESCNRIVHFCLGLDYKGFIVDIKTQDAVLRNFEIIGEAVKVIDKAIKRKYPDVQWKRIAGFRDVLIHHYFGVNWDSVWETVRKDIPVLQLQVNEIIEKEFPPNSNLF
ncbi:MAG: hypothetical protein A2Y33_14090 [Spirochaetes bacterium GWF1_51_8]|nr:MAG: hypothetical protein A2Y33_14090 [Spirochaetes bacterium GWF1_51_8]